MTRRITITRASEDTLSEQEWTFCILDERIILDTFIKRSRPSRRHNFKKEGDWYSRLHQREATLPEDAVPTPDDVFQEALQTYISTLRVGLWERDFGGRG